jgi:hypothetical protein
MKINLKNLLKKKQHFRKGGFHTNPNVGWELILGLAFVIIIAFFVLGAFLFLKTSKEFNAPFLSPLESTTSVRQEKLQNILNIFSEREKESQEILFLPAAVVDPSL